MAIEIVDFPINSMVIFHSYVNVYQRVNIWSHRHAVYVGMVLGGIFYCTAKYTRH